MQSVKEFFFSRFKISELCLSLLAGFLFAPAPAILFFRLGERTLRGKIFYLGVLGLCIGLAVYFIYTYVVRSYLERTSTRRRWSFVLAAVVFGVWFSSSFALCEPNLVTRHTLEIERLTAPESPGNFEGEVEVLEIRRPDGTLIPLETCGLNGNVELREKSLVFNREGDATLRCSFFAKTQQQASVLFVSNHAAGTAQIYLDGVMQHRVDLADEYKEGQSLRMLDVKNDNLSGAVRVAFIIFDSFLYASLIFLVLVCFDWSAFSLDKKSVLALLGIYLLALVLRSIIPAILLWIGSPNSLVFETYCCMTEISVPAQFFLILLHLPVRETPVAWIMLIQGMFDSLGCIATFYILYGIGRNKKLALAAAILYALWIPSIFYQSQKLNHAAVPVNMLFIGLSMIFALTRRRSLFWVGWVSFFMALSFFIRLDNALVFPFYLLFLLLWSGKELASRLKLSLALLALTVVFSMMIGNSRQLTFSHTNTMYGDEVVSASPTGEFIYVPFVAALYNSLAEYPGTYQGLRFWMDLVSYDYATEKAEYYEQQNDAIYGFLVSVLPGKAKLMAFVREVIIGKPVLYFDWIVSRFVEFLPSHPYHAAVTTFLFEDHYPLVRNLQMRCVDKPYALNINQYGYRFSQIYQGVKYYDYFLFVLFAAGIWALRKEKALMSLLCIYFGILIGHVFSHTGAVYFILDRENVYLDPKYLIGMVSIWPIFIPPGLMYLRDGMKKRKQSVDDHAAMTKG